MSRAAEPAPLDPFTACPRGVYEDALVTVARDGDGDGDFTVFRGDGRVHVRHRIADDDLDDALAERLSRALAPDLTDLFERVFTGIVLSARPDPIDAWLQFYRNTQRALDGVSPSAYGALNAFGEIYRRADHWIAEDGDVLEVGSCFGFLALHLARRLGRRVVASDVSGPTMRLLAAVAPRLGVPLTTRTLDARALDLPAASADTVVLVHLLEHLSPADGELALTEALRVARRRVVIAVPYEETPTAAYGHVRVVRPADLDAWGRSASGWRARRDEHHGGWLVLDRDVR